MSKKHFIALADHIRFNRDKFTQKQIDSLADFCATQNWQFKRDRWIDYIDGKCGKNGGAIKKAA